MGKRWMPAHKLRELFEAGLTDAEVAEANLRATDWRPHNTSVFYKRRDMGYGGRNASHADLLPWQISAEHSGHRYRYMLMAESRKRQGLPLSRRDQSELSLMHELLFGRGVNLVIGYDARIGWYLSDRLDSDRDIIRQPRRRGRSADPMAEGFDAGWRDDDDGPPQGRPSGKR